MTEQIPGELPGVAPPTIDLAGRIRVMSGDMRFYRHLIVALFTTSAVGCAVLKSDWSNASLSAKPPIRLASPKIDADSVSLDVAFVSISVGDESSPEAGELTGQRSGVEELWHWVDETAINPDVRAALRTNGLRIGRVHTKSEFTRALNAIRRTPQDQAAKLLAAAGVGSDASQPSRQIPCRLGKRIELPVRQPAAGEIATLVSLDGQTIGRTLDAAQPLFAITAQSKDASSVRLRMQPEIQYGAMKQTWVSNDSAMHIANRRDSWVLEPLGFEIAAEAGGTIVLGAMLPHHGLGEQMFTGNTADGEVDHVVLVIRVAELPKLLANH